jgi:hypothetical protein
MAPFGPIPDNQQNLSRSAKGKAGKRPAAAAPALTPQTQAPQTNPNVPTLSDVIPGAPSMVIPSPPKAVQQATQSAQNQAAGAKLLDFLLGG